MYTNRFLIAIIIGLVAAWISGFFAGVGATTTPEVVYTEAQIQVDGETVYMDVAHTADVTPVGALGYVLSGFQRTSPVTMGYNPTGGTGAETLVSGGLTGWNGYSDFTYIYGGNGAVTSNICSGSGTDGKNTIAWGARDSGVLATACWYTGAEECDILVSPAFDWTSIDLQTVLLHETGHCLGLGHSADTSALMYPSYHGEMRMPGADDIAGLCAIYGCTLPVPTPSPTNTPSPTGTPRVTPTPTGPPAFILYAGWNLLVAQFDTPPAAIGSANPCIQSVWLWDYATQEWNAWFPLADGMVGAVDLYEIAAGQGFWVWCQ